MMRFQPSDLGDYAAQTMLETYQQGQDVGDSYGIPGLADIIGGAVGGLLQPVVGIAGMVHEGKQNKANREQEVTMARQDRLTLGKQSELIAAQVELASAQGAAAAAGNAGTIAIASWLGGSLMVIGLAAIGIYAVNAKKVKRAEQ